MFKIKKSNYLTFLLGLSFVALPLLMSADDHKKTYSESYSVNKDAELLIDNKFGDLHIQNWNKNEIAVEVTVTVKTSSESKAQSTLDRIQIEITGNKDKVEARTIINEKTFSKGSFSVDYKVMAPATVNLMLVNKFGDIYLEEVNGMADIELAYGEIDATAINHGDSHLDLKFSEGEIGNYGGRQISATYSELDVEKAKGLKLVSRFSEINLQNVESLELDSQYDEIIVNKCGGINAVTRFTELGVMDLSGNFSFDAQYGEVGVKMISDMKGQCAVENAFADVNLTFAPGVSFELDAEIKLGSLSYPENNAELDRIEKGFTTEIYKGRIGKGVPGSKLVIECRNADVTIDY